MRISYEVFLAVSKELNVSKAAQKLYITPQCASDHIRRLEREYGTVLFERKPKFKLTAAGEIMQRSLLNIQVLENNMNRSLHSITEGDRGTITVGISTSRAPIILPKVLPQYYREFPEVNVSFIEEDTQLLEDRLLLGDLDLFVGINTTPHPDYNIQTLATEGIMLVVPDLLLRQNFDREEIAGMKEGVDLNRFSNLPFILPSFRTGKVNHAIQEYLNYNNIQLNMIYNISDSKTQIHLCSTGICAALCPRMLLDTPYMENLSTHTEGGIHTFPINHFDRNIHIDLVTHKNLNPPLFMRSFIHLLQEEIPAIAEANLHKDRASLSE